MIVSALCEIVKQNCEFYTVTRWDARKTVHKKVPLGAQKGVRDLEASVAFRKCQGALTRCQRALIWSKGALTIHQRKLTRSQRGSKAGYRLQWASEYSKGPKMAQKPKTAHNVPRNAHKVHARESLKARERSQDAKERSQSTIDRSQRAGITHKVTVSKIALTRCQRELTKYPERSHCSQGDREQGSAHKMPKSADKVPGSAHNLQELLTR